MNHQREENEHCLTDEDLVDKVLTGDRQFFRVLYERHYAMAVGVARSYVYDIHLAEDAAQESFAIAFEALSRLRDHGSFGQWLATICRRSAIKLVKSRSKEEAYTFDVAEDVQDVCQVSHQRLSAALAKLDPASREMVMLYYFSGLTYQQISETLSISQQSIHGRLQRARRKLQSLYTTQELSE